MERIGDSVRSAMRATATPNVGALASITSVWPEAVGDGIARAAWPARIARDGTLHVSTTSAAWAFELASLAPQILGRLRERVGADTPAALRFTTGPVPEPPAPMVAERSAQAVQPTEQELAEATRLAAPLTDEELRDTVARAAAASLAKQRSSRCF